MQPDDVNNFVQTRLGGFLFLFFFFFLTYAVIMQKVWNAKDGKSVQKENMRCTTEYVL